MDPRWLDWLERLRTAYQAGLTYSRDPFDRERYESLRMLAAEIAAAHSSDSIGDFERVLSAEAGYPTPKVDVRSVVMRRNQILMVREASDGSWALPGGWADVGSSPREMAEREVLEEAGVSVRATRLLALYDMRLHDHPPGLWRSYKLFVACEYVDGEPRAPTHETLDARFFDPAALPEPLSLNRVTPKQIARMIELCASPDAPTEFD